MTLGSPLAAYARWHARDALGRAAVPVILFLGMGGIPLWSIAAQRSLGAMRAAGETHAMATQIYTQTMSLAMTLGAFMLVGGLVATDRERQFVRFLFAAPVTPWRFYLQQFVIRLALFTACLALIPLGFRAIFFEVPVLPVIGSAALYGLLLGSLATLAGALFNRDGAVLLVTALVSSVLQQLNRADALPGWAAAVARALPPLGAADQIRTRWLAERALEGNDLVLVVAYSLGMLAAALWIIRHAPLTR